MRTEGRQSTACGQRCGHGGGDTGLPLPQRHMAKLIDIGPTSAGYAEVA